LVADPEGLGGRHGGGFVDHEGAGFLPKLIVGGAHFFDDFGVLSGDVGFLAGIFAHVVELLVNEAVLMIATGAEGGERELIFSDCCDPVKTSWRSTA